MAQSTLVEPLVESGQELANHLAGNGFPISAALWVKPIELDNDQDWKLIVVSPVVDDQGPGVAYQKAYDALRDMQVFEPGGVSLGMTRIIGEAHAIARAAGNIVKQHGGGPPIYVKRARFGDMEAEGLIFYVMKLPPPWEQVVLKNNVDNFEENSSFLNKSGMVEIGAKGSQPLFAGRSRSSAPAGTVVNAKIIDSADDPHLLLVLPDGRRGFTAKSNTRPA